jgi:hypothetical protein
VELRPKQESYANFMRNLSRAYYSARTYSHAEYIKALEEGESAFFIFEPFISTPDRLHLWNEYQQFLGLCSGMITKDSSKVNNDQVFKSFDMHKNHFRTHLYGALFDTTQIRKVNKPVW